MLVKACATSISKIVSEPACKLAEEANKFDERGKSLSKIHGIFKFHQKYHLGNNSLECGDISRIILKILYKRKANLSYLEKLSSVALETQVTNAKRQKRREHCFWEILPFDEEFQSQLDGHAVCHGHRKVSLDRMGEVFQVNTKNLS